MVLSNGFFYERIQLDTINERFNKVPTAKEGDANGRGMIVVLTENGLVKNTTGVSLLFKWEHTRISGAQGLEDFEPLDLTKGEYIVTYPAEMNHEGYVKAEIRIIDNGKYAGSRNMKIQVEPSVGDDTAMESSNEFSALVTALLQVNSWNTTIDGKIVEWEADMAATKQLYIDNMEEVESTYPIELNSVKQQLEQVESDFQAAVGAVTVDSEVVLARGGEVNLGNRLNASDSLLDGTLKKIEPIQNYITHGKNAFNKDKKLSETYLNTSGATAPIVGYSTLDEWLPVEAGKPYIVLYMRWICGYDIGKNLLTRIDRSSVSDPYVYTPTVDGYVRLAGYDGATSKYWFDSGYFAQETSYSGYESYKSVISNLSIVNNQKDDIKQVISDQMNYPVRVEKTGENFKLVGDFDGTKQIVIETIRNGSNNGSFKFNGTTIGVDKIHDTIDDITPIYTFIAIGGGHGYIFNKVTSVDHGKTTVDIGSMWTDGINTFTLMGINGNDLNFAVQYTEVDGVVKASIVSVVASLTHVSGAVNQANIVIGSTSTFQFYPSIKNIAVDYTIDGSAIVTDGVYNGNELIVNEKYTILDYKSLLDFHQTNTGVVFNPNNIDGVVEISNSFIFGERLKCTTSHAFRVLKKCTFGASGFLQSVKLSLANHITKRYMPNVLPKSGFDFGSGVDLSLLTTSLDFFKVDFIDQNTPPSFYVDWLLSGSVKKYGFSMGYIVDKTNSKHVDRLTNCIAFFNMRNTGKAYPRAIDGITLEPNAYMNFMGFRNYLLPDEKINLVTDRADTYAYAMTDADDFAFKKLSNKIGREIMKLQGDLTLVNSIVDTNGMGIKGVGDGILKVN